MNWRTLFNFQGINFWHLANSVGWNILWTGGSLVVTYYFLTKSPDTYLILQMGLLISIFIGSISAGYIFGKLAADNRGPTYGLVGSLGSVVLILFLVVPSGGILGLMLLVVALAGGLNGGLLSIKKRPPG